MLSELFDSIISDVEQRVNIPLNNISVKQNDFSNKWIYLDKMIYYPKDANTEDSAEPLIHEIGHHIHESYSRDIYTMIRSYNKKERHIDISLEIQS